MKKVKEIIKLKKKYFSPILALNIYTCYPIKSKNKYILSFKYSITKYADIYGIAYNLGKFLFFLMQAN